MSRNWDGSGLYDEGAIDDRNERPLTIALATIVVVWLVAFGLVSASGHVGALSHQAHQTAQSASSVEK